MPETKTQFDRLVDKIKNRPKLAILLVFGFVVIAIASFTESVDKIFSLYEKHTVQEASQEDARSKLAAVRTELNYLHSQAEPLIADIRDALEFTAEMPLEDGPWKLRDTIKKVLKTFENLIPPDDLLRLQSAEDRLDNSFNLVEQAKTSSPATSDIVIPLVKERFIKERDEAKQQIQKSVIEDWYVLHRAVTAYGNSVQRFLDGDATIEIVTESHSAATKAFAIRLSSDDNRPKLLNLLNELHTECLKLGSP